MMPSSPAIFFDKDGTLIHDVPFNVDPRRVAFRKEAFAALRRLRAGGWKFFIISNQAGVAHGYFSPAQLETLTFAMRARLARQGLAPDGFYYCPHHPQGRVVAYRVACQCRKPGDGLLRRAAREHALDLKRCWMVGDILHDVEAGRRAGCRTILLDVGHETEWQLAPARIPDHQVSTLTDAAEVILSTS